MEREDLAAEDEAEPELSRPRMRSREIPEKFISESPRSRVLSIQHRCNPETPVAAVLCAAGYWLDTFEYYKRNEIERRVKHGDVVYDVGAHVGYYSLLASCLTGPGGQVVAFGTLADRSRCLRFLSTISSALGQFVGQFGGGNHP